MIYEGLRTMMRDASSIHGGYDRGVCVMHQRKAKKARKMARKRQRQEEAREEYDAFTVCA